MNKNKIDYNKILKHIIKEYPHEMEAIGQVVYDARKHGDNRNLISFSEIIRSETWDSDEKIYLLKLFGYNENENKVEYKNSNDQIKKENQYLYCIKNDLFDSFKAIMSTFKSIKYHEDNLSKHEVLYNISTYILDYCSEENKSKYVECLLEILDENEISSFFKHSYIKKYNNAIIDLNLFISVLNTNDLELIKKYIGYIDDISSYINDAVYTNNLEIVKYFIEMNADVNYSNEFNLTPIVSAISNNNYEIFKYIVEKADINYNAVLELTTKIKNIKESNWNDLPEKITFYGRNNTINGKLSESNGRIKIVDYLYEKVEDKSLIDYTELLKFSLATYNYKNIKKYIEDSKENNILIDFIEIFRFYFNDMINNEEKLELSKNYVEQIIEFIKEYDTDGTLFCLAFEIYEKNQKQKYGLANDLTVSMIEILPKEKRNDICIMPYVNDIKTYKRLLELGVEINQVDSTGKNILFGVLSNEFFNDDKLFETIVKSLDICSKDIYGKTALYYGLKRYKELKFISKPNIEKYLSLIIKMIPDDELYDNDIRKIITNTLKDGHGLLEQNKLLHNDIFKALIERKYIFDSTMLETIYNNMNEYNDNMDYIFRNFDYNTDIQIININNYLEQIKLYVDIKNNKKSFDGFKKILEELYSKITELEKFYEQNISKKFDKEKYLEYVSKKYGSVYENLDDYLLRAILLGLSSFSEKMFINHDNSNKKSKEMLEELLDICPMYDINSIIVNEDIGLKYWEYKAMVSNVVGYNKDGRPIIGDDYFDADRVWDLENENISFTGGLVQYAILTSNIEMLQMLQKKGAILSLTINNENRSWDYVNSYEVLHYMERILGKKKYSDLGEKEKTYYLKLIGRK